MENKKFEEKQSVIEAVKEDPNFMESMTIKEYVEFIGTSKEYDIYKYICSMFFSHCADWTIRKALDKLVDIDNMSFFDKVKYKIGRYSLAGYIGTKIYDSYEEGITKAIDTLVEVADGVDKGLAKIKEAKEEKKATLS